MKSNFLNINDLVLILTSVECLFLAALMKMLPVERLQPRRILATFFLLIGVVLTTTVMVWNEELKSAAYNQLPFVCAILTFCLLLEGPVVYFYLRCLSHTEKVFQWKNIIHLLPALSAVGVIFAFNIDSNEWKSAMQLSGNKRIAVNYIWAVVKLVPIFYGLLCIWAEYRLREDLKNHYSHIAIPELRLADVVLIGFCLHWGWSLIAWLLEGIVPARISDSLGIFDNYLTVILVNGLFVFGLINTRHLLQMPHPSVVSEIKPKADQVADLKLGPKVALVEKGIHEKRLYLESNINLERFSEQIGLRPRETSAVLKHHYKSNFFEFINGLRIEEAKRLLVQPEFQDETILELIYKSGFNSPSAFHRFFKRMVGLTPTEYRRQALGGDPTEKIN